MLRGGTPDICGVCNGDNSTCMKVTKKIPFSNLNHGKHCMKMMIISVV